MDRDDQAQREQASARTCPHCGAPNWPDARRCASCGAFLSQGDEETVIDVTSGRPRVLGEGAEWTRRAPPGWQNTVEVGGSRVFIATGGRLSCLLSLIALTLAGICVCWVLWNGLTGINWL